MRKPWSMWIGLGLPVLWVLAAQPAVSQERSITLAANDVATHASLDGSLGAYYTVVFNVPAAPEGARLDHAVLELYLDVSSKARDGYENDTPVLEVYALTGDFDGALDPGHFDLTTRVTRPLLVGEDKHIVVDVTPIIRSFLAAPSTNHGLVIGSLNGMREGDFTLKSGRLPESGLMRLRVYFEPNRRS
jgi:hypothetical protein